MRRTVSAPIFLAVLGTVLAAAALILPAAAQTGQVPATATHRRAGHVAPASRRRVAYRSTSHRSARRRVSHESAYSRRLAAERRERYERHERYERYEAGCDRESAAERHDREVDELAARYEEGYHAGYYAAHAAAEKELAHQTECHVARPAPIHVSDPASSRTIARSPSPLAPRASSSFRRAASETDADSEAETASVDSPESAAPSTSGKPAPPTAPAVPAPAAPAPQATPAGSWIESATFDTVSTLHHPPITMEASLRMLSEPVPPPLRGSLASLERQDRRLEAEDLQRIEDESDLEARIAAGLLVPLPVNSALTVNPDLDPQRRYCRPWTALFLNDLARIHDALFHRPLQVDSAVRTIDYQRRLVRINGNAAPAEGDTASPHETGAAIDIAKKGMTWREIGWMRRYLLTLQNAGLIDVEEEFEQACFHITVYKTYAPARRPSLPTPRLSDSGSASPAMATAARSQ